MMKRTEEQAKIDAEKTNEDLPQVENNVTTEEIVERPNMHFERAQEVVF